MSRERSEKRKRCQMSEMMEMSMWVNSFCNAHGVVWHPIGHIILPCRFLIFEISALPPIKYQTTLCGNKPLVVSGIQTLMSGSKRNIKELGATNRTNRIESTEQPCSSWMCSKLNSHCPRQGASDAHWSVPSGVFASTNQTLEIQGTKLSLKPT